MLNTIDDASCELLSNFVILRYNSAGERELRGVW